MKLLVLTVLCFLAVANAQVRWMPASNGHVPNGSIQGGNMEGQTLFVCRITASGSMIAGKLDTVVGACIATNGGRVVQNRSYDLAFGGHTWRHFQRGTSFPTNAVLVGFTSARVATFACRANHFNRVLPGTLVNGVCHVASHGLEHRYNTCHVLADTIF